ncbi:FecCD family ABC transporter permease [Lentzea sp. NPDC058450]|uniref:FecCD family ABC transporter permease n=1 Tax=Lentzea sp. NPDC058450 TaxID=3346505 RepID=UPI00365621F5
MGRRSLGLLFLLVVLVAVCLASIAIGSKEIPLSGVWHGLFTPTGVEDDVVIRELRIPRTLLGVVVGIALGVGGALMQGHTRNPLADPGILGVTHGAALAVVLSIFLLGVNSLVGYIWFAFAGAMIASVLVFLLGSAGRGGPSPVTLALAGAAVSALMNGLVSAIVLLDQQSLDAFRFWQVGAIAGRDLTVLTQVAPFLFIGLGIAALNAPGLNAMSLGEDVAKSLGVNVSRTRGLGIFAITLLVGGAVAACGPIGFLGLVVPHIARAFTGPDYRWILPYSALLGSILILFADIVGRVVARPSEVEVGVMLALIGAPFFIYLVRRKKLVKI